MLKTNNLISLVVIVILVSIISVPFLLQKSAKAGGEFIQRERSEYLMADNNTFLGYSTAPNYRNVEPIKRMTVLITAYSSTVDQTDSTPFITASNEHVRDGIVANNLLRFGTKIKIPALFGDKVFEVEDRMATRKGFYQVDVWMNTRQEALNFGAKIATIEILPD